MRKFLAIILALLALSAPGCKPPEKKVEEAPKPLTDADRSYLRARGLQPEQFETPKARGLIRQREVWREDLKKSQEGMRKYYEEKQKKAEAERAKNRR